MKEIKTGTDNTNADCIKMSCSKDMLVQGEKNVVIFKITLRTKTHLMFKIDRG